MQWQQFQLVSSLAEAVDVLAANPETARVIAGGTDLVVQMDMDRVKGPHTLLVDVSRIDDLRHISVDGNELVVGAATTMAEVQKLRTR